MNAKVMVYLTEKVALAGHWANAGRPDSGWPREGGWISISDPDDHEAGVTIYMDRDQMLRLRDVVLDTIETMPTAGSGMDGSHVVSPAKGLLRRWAWGDLIRR